jgi:hypothetical protein
MLGRKGRDEETRPKDKERRVLVAQRSKKIGEHHQKTISTRNSEEENTNKDDQCPDGSGNELERFGKELG